MLRTGRVLPAAALALVLTCGLVILREHRRRAPDCTAENAGRAAFSRFLPHLPQNSFGPSPLRESDFQNRKGISPKSSGTKRLAVVIPDTSGTIHTVLRKRSWNPGFLADLQNAQPGDSVNFELIQGEQATGTLQQVDLLEGNVIRVAGRLSQPESGRFFFQKQTRPGVAGGFVGLVEFPGSRRAYRIEPTGPDRSPELVERPLAKVLCIDLPAPEGTVAVQPENVATLRKEEHIEEPTPDYQNGIVALQSLPNALGVLYLDYQGGYTPTWGGIAYARPDVDNDQIHDVWQRVAEDFRPFNINVTTDLEVYERAPEESRQRVIITPTTTAAPWSGGVAYVGSFNWTGDTPCWVFALTGKMAAEAISHEAGHTLGLLHDGRDAMGVHNEYYSGQGAGITGWAPIMGLGYFQNVTQWSKGEYANANNDQDDLAIVTSQNNNVDYRPDDTGENLQTARNLNIAPDHTVSAQGLIERTGDVDAFRFVTRGGAISLRVDPADLNPNLALQATLYDAKGTLLASNNPQTVLSAAISIELPPGVYTFRVAGAGRNDPLTNGFSDYASLGSYWISGSISNLPAALEFAPLQIHQLPEQASLRLQILTATNLKYMIEQTTRLAEENWTTLSTNWGTGDLLPIIMPVDKSLPSHFFRVRIE